MPNFNYPVEVVLDHAVERETRSAILICAGGRDIWIPRSHIAPKSQVQGFADTGTLTITHWLAREKGLL